MNPIKTLVFLKLPFIGEPDGFYDFTEKDRSRRK